MKAHTLAVLLCCMVYYVLAEAPPPDGSDVELFYFEDGTILDRAARALHLGRSLEFAEILGRGFYNQMINTGQFHQQVVSHLQIPTLTWLQKKRLFLVAATLEGNFDTVKRYLPEVEGLNFHMYEDMCSPLDMAIYKGDSNLGMVMFLVDNGADVNMKNGYGESPLYVATVMNHKKLVEYLLEKGANVNETNRDGITVPMAAVYLGNVDILEQLLKKGANTAPIVGDRDFVEILVEKPRNTCERGYKVWDLLAQYAGGWRLQPKQLTLWKMNNECQDE